ncbi:MAG: endopeptidase La [Pseudomonadota bacterium]
MSDDHQHDEQDNQDNAPLVDQLADASATDDDALQKTYGLIPVLPLRDIVVFPSMIVPLFVGRKKSVRALQEVVSQDKRILLVTQKNAADNDPAGDDLHEVGCVAQILQLLKLPDDTVKILVEGQHRAQIDHYEQQEPYFQAHISPFEEEADQPVELKALRRTVISRFEHYAQMNKKIAPEVLVAMGEIESPGQIADTVIMHLNLPIIEKQEILETKSFATRLERVYAHLENEISVLSVESRIRRRVKSQMDKTQREYYLNEQLKAIQKELGDGEDGRDELQEIEDKISKLGMSKEAKEKATGELKKLRNMSSMSAEATVVRNYLDWMVTLPWSKKSRVKKDIVAANKILDEDHYGLDKVKDRILEYLAVQNRTNTIRGPILCLVGPPGVGKTSLGKSIARATGRKFVRMSLGGVRDEAEIRGHRRTYIGSMPGKIIQGMRKAKAANPLFLLDEVDKLGTDYRGDPTSALLEVLDPEQNNTFNDHYLEVDYDLSNVMFVCTANTENMPRPLLDRMEIIRISGYTEDEKVKIAHRHLIPRQRTYHGLRKKEWEISEKALREIIRTYTREAGVRNLDREIASLTRKAVKDITVKKQTSIRVTGRNISRFLGVPRYRFGQMESNDLVGVTTGLAWTEVGGELLSVEAVTLPGKGKIIITGKLGDVMKESVQAAESYVKSRALRFGIPSDLLAQTDIHVHVPEGATPKDGPSAGVAMVTSIVSSLLGIPIRRDVAMTGEISLRGRTLPIGGLKEKLLAALRGGLQTVVIPAENAKNLEEIPANAKRGLKIVPVEHVDDVLSLALTEPLVPIEVENAPPTALPPKDSNAPAIRH